MFSASYLLLTPKNNTKEVLVSSPERVIQRVNCKIGDFRTWEDKRGRQLITVVNAPQMKEVLSQYDLVTDTEYETPPGQKPTLSSFLLWAARRRNVAGVSLWVPIPFYLVAIEDPQACRKTLDFLDKRFGLGLDFTDLDEEVARQNRKIAQVRNQFPELDDYIRKLESNLSLTKEENEKLAEGILQFLQPKD